MSNTPRHPRHPEGSQAEVLKTTPFVDAYLQELAEKYFRVLMLHSRGGITGEWSNVSDHCIIEAAIAEHLSGMLNLTLTEARRLCRAALAHDWDKRLERTGTPANTACIEGMHDADVDWQLVRVTHPDQIHRIEELAKKAVLSTEEILFYIDNICKGSEVVTLEERLADVQHRGGLNGASADRELRVSLDIEKKIIDHLVLQKIVIPPELSLPAFLKKAV